MLNATEVSEIKSATEEDLKAIIKVMGRQIEALFFVGDRDRSIAIRDAAVKELLGRAREKRHQ